MLPCAAGHQCLLATNAHKLLGYGSLLEVIVTLCQMVAFYKGHHVSTEEDKEDKENIFNENCLNLIEMRHKAKAKITK